MPTLDGKVVSAKLRSHDYETFKKRCESEGTTVSKKISEMIFDYMYGGFSGEIGVDLSRLEELAGRVKKSPQEVLDMMINKCGGY